MKILYLTWGEVPRMSSVYGGQVVGMLENLQKHKLIDKAVLLAGYPIVHSGMVREKHRYPDQLRQIKDAIGPDNFLTRRIPVPPVGIYPKPWQMPFFLLGQVHFLSHRIRSMAPDIVHCRSYLATYLAVLARRKSRGRFRIVFDARSLMPDEAVISGRWDVDTKSYNFWKKIELDLLHEADATLAVSAPMKEWYDNIGAKRTEILHLNVDTDLLDAKLMSCVDRLNQGAPILSYAGYLSEDSWHDPVNLWSVFASFRQHVPKARLLVITKSNQEALKRGMVKSGFEHILPYVRFSTAASPRETVGQLQLSDLAIFSYRTPRTDFELKMSEPTFATKTAEYLCAGLPVLVNRHCGGARDYVLSRDAGVAYDPQTPLARQEIDTLLRQSQNRPRISKIAYADFSVVENSKRLVSLYRSLTG